jgi:hypothetical protein
MKMKNTHIKNIVGNYTGCRKINVFQGGGLVGKNLRNLQKNKIKNMGGGGLYKDIWI